MMHMFMPVCGCVCVAVAVCGCVWMEAADSARFAKFVKGCPRLVQLPRDQRRHQLARAKKAGTHAFALTAVDGANPLQAHSSFRGGHDSDDDSSDGSDGGRNNDMAANGRGVTAWQAGGQHKPKKRSPLIAIPFIDLVYYRSKAQTKRASKFMDFEQFMCAFRLLATARYVQRTG